MREGNRRHPPAVFIRVGKEKEKRKKTKSPKRKQKTKSNRAAHPLLRRGFRRPLRRGRPLHPLPALARSGSPPRVFLNPPPPPLPPPPPPPLPPSPPTRPMLPASLRNGGKRGDASYGGRCGRQTEAAATRQAEVRWSVKRRRGGVSNGGCGDASYGGAVERQTEAAATRQTEAAAGVKRRRGGASNGGLGAASNGGAVERQTEAAATRQTEARWASNVCKKVLLISFF